MTGYLEVLVSDMMGFSIRYDGVSDMTGYLEVLTPTATFPFTSLTNTERIA